MQMNLFTKLRILTDLENKLMVARGKDGGRVWDRHVHTTIFKMHNQQAPTIQYRELFSMLCGSLDGRGVWGRMDVCVWLSPFAVHLKLSKHYYLDVVQNKIKSKRNQFAKSLHGELPAWFLSLKFHFHHDVEASLLPMRRNRFFGL